MATSTAIGIDIGGSFIKSGVVASDGNILYENEPIPTPSNGPLVVKAVEGLIQSLLKRSNPTNAPLAAGISSCGIVDSAIGEVIESVAIPEYNGTNFKKALQGLGIPVHVENDARSAAWAEYELSRDKQDLALITVGTGVGCAVITQGKLWQGANASAGELGHITIDLNGPVCLCGNVGCLELYVAQQAILDFVRNSLKAEGSVDGPRSVLKPDGLSIRTISLAEANGDALAHRAFEWCGQMLGIGITSLVNLFNPRVVLVGGGIIDASPTILNSARRVLFSRALSSAQRGLVLEKARLGNQAGLIGAALSALHAIAKNG